MNDYYADPGVARTASDEEIKRAYRRLARQLHPDVNPSTEAHERFKAVSQAYDVLSDPEKKRAYDMGADPYAGAGAGGFGAGFSFSDVMDAFFGAFKTYERTIGVDLYSQLKQDTVYAKVRKYPDSITRSLDRNNIPVKVFDTLIAQTNATLPTLYRYFRPRAKMLGVS